MFQQLEKYKNPTLKLSVILRALFDQVTANRFISHYFLAVQPDAMMEDVHKFSHFVMLQSDSIYRDPLLAQKTSMPQIKVSSSVFEEVHKILVKILKEQEITEEDIPRLSFEILEIVEESRAQFSDTVMMFLKTEDITQEMLFQILNRYKFEAKIGGKNEVQVKGNVEIPIALKIRPKDKSIVLMGKAVAVENSKLELVADIAERVLEKYPTHPSVRAVEDDDDWPFLLMEKSFPYDNGIPLRLLFRHMKSFSTAFSLSLKCDSQKILLFNLTP